MKYKNTLRRSLIATLMLVSSSIVQADNSVGNDYKLSSDDVVSVSVFNEADLSVGAARVGADGTISLPLLGRINVKGLTINQVDRIVTDMLLDGYLKKPRVNVTISEYRPFYIEGEVNSPGSYPYRKGLTLLKAVTLAGGFTERASKRSIDLIRETNDDANKKRYSRVRLSQTIKPGDIITVNESFF